MINLYRWLWTRIGGRQWTYIIRDIYHDLEYLIILALILIGVALGKCLTWWQVVLALGIFTIGYIGGHLFWGTPYHKGQKGNEREDK